MNLPADSLQLSQEEQGRLLARVYAFILSDEFTGNLKVPDKTTDIRSTKNSKTQIKEISHGVGAQLIKIQEPMLCA